MVTEAKEGSNPALDHLRSLSLTEFRRRYSSDKVDLDGFEPKNVFATSNEFRYPEMIEEITVRGGIHLAVAGGLDPALGQVAKANPDLTILCDINPFAVPMIDTRLRLLEQAENGREYWEMFKELLDTDPRLVSNIAAIAGDGTASTGWSSRQHFSAVRSAWQKGAIKLIHTDIATDGIQTGMEIARDTGVPIRLINLSNIFDWRENRSKLSGFKTALRTGIADGTIDPGSQIVAASIHNNMRHQVWTTSDFADPRRSLV